MRDSIGGYRALVLGAIALCITATLTGARAGQNNAPGLKVALVDPGKLLSESKYAQTRLTEFQKKRSDLFLSFKVAEDNPYLSEAEQKKLAEFASKEVSGGLSEDEKKQRQELLTANKQASDQHNSLLSKQVVAITQQDRDKLNQFQRLREETGRRLEFRQQQEGDRLKKEFDELDQQVRKRVRELIAKAAKDKGANLVLTNEVAWYADMDLTEPVMAELNK